MIEKRSCQDDIPVLGVMVGEYWSWAYSGILNNTDRAVFAEFVVGSALGVTEAPRMEWDAIDLRYGDKTIEVKSSAYVQSWHQRQDSPAPRGLCLFRSRQWAREIQPTAVDHLVYLSLGRCIGLPVPRHH